MKKLFISHEIAESGMALLREQADVDVIVMNTEKIDEFGGIEEADGIILRIGRISRELMDRCPNLKVISRPGVGVDSIDVDAATERDTNCNCQTRSKCPFSGGHTLTLTYALAKT